MVNDGTCNSLVYLEGEQVRWLLDLNPKQWSELEEVVGNTGEIDLNMVLTLLINIQQHNKITFHLDNCSFFHKLPHISHF